MRGHDTQSTFYKRDLHNALPASAGEPVPPPQAHHAQALGPGLPWELEVLVQNPGCCFVLLLLG